MERIKIQPYTIIALLGNKEIFSFTEHHIIPLLKSHNIEYVFCKSSIETESLADVEIFLKFPSKAKIYIIGVADETGYNTLSKIADRHHYTLINFELDGERVDFPLIGERFYINPFDDHTIFYEENTDFKKIVSNVNHVVVGDIHGSYDTFIEMLKDNKGITIHKNKIIVTDYKKYVKHILVGDFIDKGTYKGIRKMIEFLYANLEHFIICVGNHEYWVAEYLQGNIEPSETNTALIGQWFQTVILLMHDEDLKKKFFTIYHASYHCVETPLAYITHAPCKNRFIGKGDKISLREQRNMRYPKMKEYDSEEEYFTDRENFFSFLLEEANEFNKYHIFGHTMIPDIFKYKNKICLDTGCVVGGKLSVAIFNEEGELAFKSYPSKNTKKTELLLPYFVNRQVNIEL